MIEIENTSIKGRYNLINTKIKTCDDNHWLRQLSKEEVIHLGKSILDLLNSESH